MSRDILLNLIDPDSEQPRKQFDAVKLAELAQSIKQSGLAVPILLRPAGDRFIIVHGERRYRAAFSLGWDTIPAEVRDISASEAKWLALAENVQRADLSPIEEARAYQARLADGITQTELGKRIGKTQSYVATKLRFLRLPHEVQAALDDGAISEGHAKQLLRVKAANAQSSLCERAIAGQWTVARTRIEVNMSCDTLAEEKWDLGRWLAESDNLTNAARKALPLLKEISEETKTVSVLSEVADTLLSFQNMLAEHRIRGRRIAGRILAD